ncbi:ATP-dependent Clp protease ATP-binding subunit [Cryobacterium sp. MDB1-18-2]|uniref:ATP-dependent Clp protease ATP-binding subunit n=1 Tax=unclassified Cryobacterium TaxID=2649013 RepID=UPI001069C408|nr:MULTISPECIES: ATP-dependent Clp protease ATP-binding subunit [unclassified Cryobacterium]TFB95181.1 ATP-dependent Clp protease ATP-binding subunit [Cryobacterium sp. MDB2-A-1]TFC11216.1 ATP-dependent Clp protease ATP-binding subunit [Cryobacterium sp. MDB2-A-2]TFC11512.1 ATP-dependent Clp protease ATP-binding subunit [Cryobacterium sp. MDB2-33-2]TFC25824.1 ATP-dependent Clp protease ATP-binding subunit [Cryobacterium sp. MDB1-18-2]TFC45655.1 ATP-dependent Clp protease ATP-binding subunit [C
MPTFFGPADSGNGSFDEFIARYLQGQQGAAPTGRPIDITRLLSRRTHEVLAEAAQYAVEHGHSHVDVLHILRVLVLREPAAQAIRNAGADPAALALAAEQRLPERSAPTGDATPGLTPSAQRALLDAHQIARAFGSTYIDPEHLFFAFVVNEDSPAGQVLAAAGVTQESLQAGAREPQADATGQDPAPASASETPMLDTYGTDLTARARDGKLDPVIGRADEIEQTIEILSRRTKNNPVLIGEAGVGKTAVVEGLAQAIVAGTVPEQLRGKRVVALDLAAMVAGTRYRGDFEERLGKTMDEITAHSGELVIFIDELHTVVGAGGSGDGGMDAGNILKPRLARGELHVIGATTLKEYRKVEKDPALERRFQTVRVGEPSIDDAVSILAGLRGRYEEHHGVRYTDEALRAAVELSARYVSDRFLPDKAIDLIDQAGARLRLTLGSLPDREALEALRARVVTLEEAKSAAVLTEQYEEASRLRDEIETVQAQLQLQEDPAQAVAAEAVVGEAEIAGVIARATGIPVARLTADDRSRLGLLEAELHERVVGQDDAVTLIAKAVRRNRTGMNDAGRPVGSFLFLGPTGVGKTELAKALAESLFGDEHAMVRFDMSEFGERHTVSRLVGSPPGYVGYDEAGQLTERVRRNPYSVILLDEIEKAHPDVFNLLLQVLDDGRLTDGQGRTVDFRNTVIIMTSNLGSEFLASRSGALGFTAQIDGGADNGFGSEKALRDRVMGKLREAMRPEFLNRLDEIVLFRKLDAPQLHDIVRMLLAGTRTRLAAQGFALTVSEDAIDWIATRGYEPEYGARPLRRVIQRELDDKIADLLVGSDLLASTGVDVSVADGALVVAAAASAPAQPLPLAA